MIAGMVPMALGWSEGSEQSAPLGRAVIGGLVAATLATLIVLPTVFAIIQNGAARGSASIDPFDPQSTYFVPDQGAGVATAGVPTNGAIASGFSPRLPSDRGFLGIVVLAALGSAISGCTRPSPAQTTHSQQSDKTKAASVVTRVDVVRPDRRTIGRTTQQPGQIEAYEVTPIHARVAGYVQKWNVDIGAKVKQGQVLAVLSVPELDAEVEQKQAAVEETQAKLAQARAAEEVAQASLASVQAKLIEVRAGTKRTEADLAPGRPKPRASSNSSTSGP